MPESNHKFNLGVMNKDADERLVLNGEYRDALNAQVSTSDNSDVGSLQTLMGNLDISNSFINLDADEKLGPDFEYYCIGSITDGKKDRIYWLLAGAGKDIIAEYDYNTKIVSPVVVDIYNNNVMAGPGSGRVLNFDKNFLVTGINIIDNFLFWTDNNTEPKQVNITRAKIGCIDPATLVPGFNYQTDLYVKTRKQSNQNPPFINVGVMKEEHITVIKKAPRIAPRLEMKNTLRGDVDGDGNIGNIVTTINIENPVTTLLDSENNYLTTPIDFYTNTLVDYEVGDLLVLSPNTEGLTSSQKLGELVIRIDQPIQYTNIGGFGPYTQFMTYWDQGNISANTPCGTNSANMPCVLGGPAQPPSTGNYIQATIVGGTILVNDSTIGFDVKLKQDKALFKFKFPRFASRYKYTDGQYSTFSPFSEIAFLPGEFDYLPKEGYNLGMVNSVRKLAVKDFVDRNIMPDDVVEVDILYKESNSPIVYTIQTIKRVDIDGGKYDSWNAIDASTTSATLSTTGFINITSEIVHAMVPSNQLLRVYDNVPRKALAQEVVGNRIVYANYLQNYDMYNSLNVYAEALRSSGAAILEKNLNITVDVNLQYTSKSLGVQVPELLNPANANNYSPSKSIKTLRTYQLGVVYIDEFGRETPVFSSSKTSKNAIQIEKNVASYAGRLKAQLLNIMPEWAHGFKFLIKESSNEYYNLAMDRWYPAQDGNIWLSFPSAERNKIDDETFLILKKEHNNDTPVPDNTRYKVIAIENEAPLFIKTRRVAKSSVTDGDLQPVGVIPPRIIGTNALGGNDRTTGFPQPDGTFIDIDYETAASVTTLVEKEGILDYEFRINGSRGASNWYGIQSYEVNQPKTRIEIKPKKAFGADMSCTSSSSWAGPQGKTYAVSDLKIEFARKEVKNLPEFDGRFFVKVLNDSVIKDSIIGNLGSSDNVWIVKDAITSQYINPQNKYSALDPHDTWDEGSTAKWFNLGTTANHISLASSAPHGNGVDHPIHSALNKAGEHYWDLACHGSKSTSSGWFIDKVEGFRTWKMTGALGWNFAKVSKPPGRYADESYRTNKAGSNSDTSGTRTHIPGLTTAGDDAKMQIVGTNTFVNLLGENKYLNITNNKQHNNNTLITPQPTVGNLKQGFLRTRISYDLGGIIPSVGINEQENLIHLSFSGIGDGASFGLRANLSNINAHFGSSVWANAFAKQQSFSDQITTPGTLWRWKEDPDGIIYETTGHDPYFLQDPSSSYPTIIEFNRNHTDYVDKAAGVPLYNYAGFTDYMTYHYSEYYTKNFGSGEIKQSGMVTNDYTGWGSHSGSYATYLGLVLTSATILSFLGTHANNDLSGGKTANGWGPSAAHHKWACVMSDWNRKRAKRRRFTFGARPYAFADGTKINLSVNLPLPVLIGDQAYDDNSGTTRKTGGYLPTNDPDLDPHFNVADGTVLQNVLYGDDADPTDADLLRPITKAPGIRPDGVFTGYIEPGNTTSSIPSIKTTDDDGIHSEAPGSCTWEIIEAYTETDDEGSFTTTNPAIWETEPKEDLDLDLYYEVGQIYPTRINSSTMEQFVGPIRDKRHLNTKVTCWMPSWGGSPGYDVILSSGSVYDLTSATIAGDPLLVGSVTPGHDDIRVVSHEAPIDALGNVGSDRHVWLEDVNGVPLTNNFNPLFTPVLPLYLSRLRFTREDGSVTETTFKKQAEITPAPSLTYHNAFELDEDPHNYEVTLPYFNAYSFGNGVESNRIRDDYNQVFIDKGPKVSSVLEEPYMEDRRSSGLIYSGIYNSTSNVNNLNQFIQAEKITKDLNPDGGSIQKLYTRDTNLVTLCEDKVFKILASKDALFNADGNPQLIATNKVLGQATTFAGDHGISTNPESFAVDSFRMYFTDRVRGSVIRLSMDGITPISSIGMTDWFNDNLVNAKRLIGSFDDKKKEYNLSLGYFDYSTYSVGILCEQYTPDVPISLISSTPPQPVIPNPIVPIAPGILILSGDGVDKFKIGDVVRGEGIPLNSVISNIEYKGGGQWWLKINLTPTTANMVSLGSPSKYKSSSTLVSVGTNYTRWTYKTRITASIETQPSNTLSFSEQNKGWVSFKSFVKENGISLNNEYFTFKKGMLWQHHTNPIHNNFYNQQFDSSVEVLFNEIPGSVKSFGTLNYEGSQSHITQDLENSAEYWDNKNKLGWYVSNLYTDMQEGSLHEFKDKENKWFSQMKGVTTRWVDDGTGGNIDTNEFSFQGIDDNDGIEVIDGGYTSWDCSPLGNNITCGPNAGVIIVNLPSLIDSPNYQFVFKTMIDWMIENDPSALFTKYSFNYNLVGLGTFYISIKKSSSTFANTFSFSGDDVISILSGAGLSTNTPIADNSMLYYMSSVEPIQCDRNTITESGHACEEIQGQGGAYLDEIACLSDTKSPCGDLCKYQIGITPYVTDAVDINCLLGSIYVTSTLDLTATSWTVSYVAENVTNVAEGTVFQDQQTYFFPGDSNAFTLQPGEYVVFVTDSNGCTSEEIVTIDCTTIPPIPCSTPVNMLVNTVNPDCTFPDAAQEGKIIVLVNSISAMATSWTVEYISLVNGISTSILVDDNNGSGYTPGATSSLNNLPIGDYIVEVTDDMGCFSFLSVVIECAPQPACIYGSDAWDTTLTFTNANGPNCNDGTMSLNLDLAAGYVTGGQPFPLTVTVDFFNDLNYPNGLAISTNTYNVSSFPLTLTETNLQDGQSYRFSLIDNNGCTDLEGYGPLTCNLNGCTDPFATNYDPLATVDDGSCVGPCAGAAVLGSYWTYPQETLNPLDGQFNFEMALHLSYGVDNINPNTGDVGRFKTQYACPITELILVNKAICDLSGLEAFTNLTKLDVSNNGRHSPNFDCEIEILPTSALPLLEYIDASENSISKFGFDFTNNTQLRHLDLANSLMHLPSTTGWGFHECAVEMDLSQNTLLEHLDLHSNFIADLDLSTNVGNLTYLDVSTGYNSNFYGPGGCGMGFGGLINTCGPINVNLGHNIDLNNLTLIAGGWKTPNMTIQVGSANRAILGNSLLAGGAFSIPASATFIQ